MRQATREVIADCIPRLFIAVVVILAVTACGGGSDGGNAAGGSPPPGGTPAPPPPAPPPPPGSPTPPPPQAFRVVPAGISLDKAGTGQLFAVGATAAVTWSTGDASVVTVDPLGRLQPVGRGTTTVTATVTATTGTSTSTASVRVFDTQAATPDATSEALIAAAVAANQVTAEQALVYRVYAAFGDSRLPAQFDGAPAGTSTSLLMREVSGRLPSLSTDARSTLRPFFVPPIYAESWFAQQFGLDAATASVQGGQVRIQQVPGGDTCTLMTLGIRRRATAHFNIWTVESPALSAAVRTDALASEQLASLVGDMLEEIYQAETSLLNRFPKNDLGYACNGGDGAVDVYLTPLLGTGAPAVTNAYPGACEDVSSFINVNYHRLANDTSSGGGGETGRRYFRSVVAHEFTHVLQFAMDRGADCNDKRNYEWIDEATAQWMMDHVFPTDDFEDGLEKLGGRRRSGQFFANYLLNDHMAALENAGSTANADLNGYSDYAFFQYIARKHGATVIKSIYDAMTAGNGWQALHAGVDSIGGMDRVWHEFALALWNDPDNPILERMPDNYDIGAVHALAGLGRERSARKPEQRNVVLDSGPRRRMDLLSTAVTFGGGYEIEPRSIHFEHLKFTDATVSSVLVTMPIVTGARQGALKLQAVPKIDGQWKPVEDWSQETHKFFCRDKRSERIDELILVVSYAENAPATQTAKISRNDPLMVSTSNVGCWKWEGSASVRLRSSGFGAESDGTASAGNVVFEAPDSSGVLLRLFAIKGGQASGRSVFTQGNCTNTITGPPTGIVETDTASLGVNLDLEMPRQPPPDRRVWALNGVKFIDSTSVTVCNGTTTTVAAPSTGWAWLNYPLTTHPLSVAEDGRTVEANVSIPHSAGSTHHQFRFTAQRE